MILDELDDAKASVKSICDRRKQTLIKLLELVDMYAIGSLVPHSEFDDYERIKKVLIERHSQHESL